MQECVGVALQLAAITLSEELDYARAAEKLHVSLAELTLHIVELKELLQLRIFEMERGSLVVTKAGRIFLNECRNFLPRNGQECCHSGCQ